MTVLREIEEERGRMFSEAEYQEMRQEILQELSHGARRRPFTLFTFAAIAIGLLLLLGVGLIHARDRVQGDYLLAVVSLAGLSVEAYLFWSYQRSIQLDAYRSLPERLAEIEELRAQRLVSSEEYDAIRANILMQRQYASR